MSNMASEEISKDEKEARLNLRMEHIRRQNEALRKRYEEVEADKREAESHLFHERTSSRKVPEDRPGPRQRTSQKRTEDKVPPAFAAPDRDKKRQQRLSENDGPPPDPSYSFLADRLREGNDSTQDRHQGSRRHPGNYGGQDFENVRNSLQQRRAQEKARPQQPPRNKMEMSMRMTGRERWEYEQWLSERNRIEQDRINRQMTASGEWRREWDREKSHRNSRDDAKEISGGRPQWSARGRGRGRASWKESNNDWSQKSTDARFHEKSDLHCPKDQSRETGFSSPSNRQVQMKEDVINISVSNNLVGRVGLRMGDAPETSTRGRSSKGKGDDYQKNEREWKRKEKSSSRAMQFKEDSGSGTTEVQVKLKRSMTDKQQRPEEMQKGQTEAAFKPLQMNLEVDTDIEKDVKSKNIIPPVDYPDEESWDDEGSWEDATTSGNESQENLEDSFNPYESGNEENVQTLDERLKTKDYSNNVIAIPDSSRPIQALNIDEQIEPDQHPSEELHDILKADSTVSLASAESKKENYSFSQSVSQQCERDIEDRERTPQAEDYGVEIVEKSSLADGHQSLDISSIEMNEDREKTPQPSSLPLQYTMVMGEPNPALAVQTQDSTIEGASEPLQRFDKVDDAETDIIQVKETTINCQSMPDEECSGQLKAPTVELEAAPTELEVNRCEITQSEESLENTDYNVPLKQVPDTHNDCQISPDADDFTLRNTSERDDSDESSRVLTLNKSDEEGLTAMSRTLPPLTDSENISCQSSNLGGNCEQNPHGVEFTNVGEPDIKHNTLEKPNHSHLNDECHASTPDRLERVEDLAALDQSSEVIDNQQTAPQEAICNPNAAAVEPATSDQPKVLTTTKSDDTGDQAVSADVGKCEADHCHIASDKTE